MRHHALLLPLPRKFRCHRYDTPEVRVGRLRVPPPHACTLGRASGVRLELNALHRRREVTRAGLLATFDRVHLPRFLKPWGRPLPPHRRVQVVFGAISPHPAFSVMLVD
jgi:hypothetical protein